MAKRESLARDPRWNHALSAEEHFVGHVAEEDAQREGGRGEEGGAVDGAAERFREVAIAGGGGGGDVVGAARGRVVDGPLDRAEGVFAIDPRHPLPPASDGTAGAEAERQQHLLQRAAALVEHDAEPQNDQARERLRLASGGLPLFSELREEAAAARRRLVGGLVAEEAVVADGGGADERARLARIRAHRLDQRTRRVEAARDQPLLARWRPTPLAHVLAREID